MNNTISPEEPQKVPVSPTVKPKVEEDEKFFAALGYFGFLFVVPLIAKPKSEYCKFHAKQSMVLFLVFIVALIVLATFSMLGSLLMIVIFAVYVLSIFRAYSGEMWNIPFISSFAGKMDINSLYGKAGLAISGISGMKEKVENMAQQAQKTAEKSVEQQDTEAPKEEK